jgi:glutamine amidotransferase
MFGLIGNRPDLATRVLKVNADVLTTRVEAGKPVGWGVGFYQAGEVLLRRRPVDERRVLDLAEAAGTVRADVLIGHVRRPGIGALRTENTHPFRYRHWLFAQTGNIQGFEQLEPRLVEAQPEFLRRNIRGDTDSERFFYLFLSFLHDAGHLDDVRVAPNHVREALRATIALVDRLSAEEGFGENTGDLLVANGETLFAVHRAGKMAYRCFEGRFDVEELLAEDSGLRASRVPSVDRTHYCLVAAELNEVPSRWQVVEGRVIGTFTRDAPPSFDRL